MITAGIVALVVTSYVFVIVSRLVSDKKPLVQGVFASSGLMFSACAFWSSTAEQWFYVCTYTVWFGVFIAVLALVNGALREAAK